MGPTGVCLPDLTYYWNRIKDHAGIEGVRIHDLRHSHASRALALGESLTMIGRILGHSKVGHQRPICASRARRGEGRGGAHRRQHRRSSRGAGRRGGIGGTAMAVLQYRTLSNRTVEALFVERDTVFWDRAP